MQSNLIVLTGSGVNRKNIVIPSGALFHGFENAKKGTPSFLNHDYHRLIGWVTPISLVINQGLSLLIGSTFFPETREECEIINDRAINYLSEHLYVDEEVKNSFLVSLKSRHNVEEVINIGTAIIAIGKNILRIEYPELFLNEDEDGLIGIDILKHEHGGIFSYKDILVFPNKKFRRSCSLRNNLNEEFLTYYSNIRGNFSKKISIDDSIIGLKSSLTYAVELDFWWGPKFSKDIMTIEDGVTRHGADIESGLRNIIGIDYVDFRWSTNKEDKKVFECEEVVNIPSYGISEERYGCKYTHAIFPQSSICEHVDGAIRIYSDIELIEREESDLAKSGKNTEYQKLWRIDGEIQSELFMKLCHYYYRSNTLVSEYFCDESDERIKKNNPQASVHKPYSKVIGSFKDIIVSCGFTHMQNANKADRYISGQLSFDSQRFTDYSVVDLKKIFARKSLLFTEENCLVVDYQDVITNIPPIYHCGLNCFSNAKDTIECIKDYLIILNNDNLLRIASFTVACETNDEENEFVYFSYCGSIEDILEFFNKCNPLPNDYQEIKIWCGVTEEYTRENKELFNHNGDILDFVLNNGMLYFSREFFDSYEIQHEQGNLLVKFPEPIESNFSFATVVKNVECTNCNSDYFLCNCIALENSKPTKIKEFETIGFFHTDRSAFSHPAS